MITQISMPGGNIARADLVKAITNYAPQPAPYQVNDQQTLTERHEVFKRGLDRFSGDTIDAMANSADQQRQSADKANSKYCALSLITGVIGAGAVSLMLEPVIDVSHSISTNIALHAASFVAEGLVAATGLTTAGICLARQNRAADSAREARSFIQDLQTWGEYLSRPAPQPQPAVAGAAIS